MCQWNVLHINQFWKCRKLSLKHGCMRWVGIFHTINPLGYSNFQIRSRFHFGKLIWDNFHNATTWHDESKLLCHSFTDMLRWPILHLADIIVNKHFLFLLFTCVCCNKNDKKTKRKNHHLLWQMIAEELGLADRNWIVEAWHSSPARAVDEMIDLHLFLLGCGAHSFHIR